MDVLFLICFTKMNFMLLISHRLRIQVRDFPNAFTHPTIRKAFGGWGQEVFQEQDSWLAQIVMYLLEFYKVASLTTVFLNFINTLFIIIIIIIITIINIILFLSSSSWCLCHRFPFLWYFSSWTSGAPHHSGFKFQIVALSLLLIERMHI
jgi:hypothetical protein